jgi:hypothetical protein
MGPAEVAGVEGLGWAVIGPLRLWEYVEKSKSPSVTQTPGASDVRRNHCRARFRLSRMSFEILERWERINGLWNLTQYCFAI